MAKFVKMRLFHTKWEKMRFWAIFRATRVVWSNGWAFVSNVWSFFGLKMTQNDPKMTPKWPQNDQKSIFSKMFLHHFWPFLGWFGVILGCFERVLVIFGPRNAFKWPYLGSKMGQKWAKNRFSQKWFTWLLGILGVVWGHFRLLWAVIWLQRPQNDPKTTQNDPKRPKTTQNDPKWPQNV